MSNDLVAVTQKLTEGISHLPIEEQIKKLHEWGVLAGKVKLYLTWLMYNAPDWYIKLAGRETDQAIKFDFRYHIANILELVDEDGGYDKSGYPYQFETILRVLCWTATNWVCLNGERITPEDLIATVPISQFLKAMPIFNNAVDDMERAWCVYQWAKGVQVTPIRDMVFLEPPETEVDEETKDEADKVVAKPKAVVKQLPNGKFTIKISDIEGNGDISIIDIQNSLDDLVEWVR